MAKFVVGITGGIGSGKTAVSDRFRELGVTVVDADVAARVVVEPGQPGLDDVTARFGTGVLNKDGTLDRAALRARIFEDPAERRWLERTLHPRINQLIADDLAAATSAYAVLVNPLMRGRDPRADRILVVDVPEEVQIARTVARDDVDEEQTRAIIASQLDRESRRHLADDLVSNDSSLADLHAAVDHLHRCYLALAAKGKETSPRDGPRTCREQARMRDP